MTYIQLLKPDKLRINKITVCIDDTYYGFFSLLKENKYKSSSIENSVSDDILFFLSKCYKLIPYRNSKSEIRNIPYVIFDYSRNIEDIFLMLYKTIECYYKKQNIKGITSSFINYSIHNNYDKFKKNIDFIENALLLNKIDNVSIRFNIHKLNYNYLDNFVDLMSKYNIKNISFSFVKKH